jgi:hypothetical protein
MRVALVTTWGTACGIAEHSAYLKAAVQSAATAADPGIEIVPVATLDPAIFLGNRQRDDLIWLNYHAALHSQWTPEWIRRMQERGIKVGVTYHDTGVPNSDQCKGICAAADAFVVHEPYDDLEGHGHYWRMGVPDWPGERAIERGARSWTQGRPVLGTVGFPFPWKNYDELARVTKANGWALLLFAPNATVEDIRRWDGLNPWIRIYPSFESSSMVISELTACDATAFCYTCANTGQSGAVCQGIAARKPVVAFESCRQFRALFEDPLANEVIYWTSTFDQVGRLLRNLTLERCHSGTVALAEQDSWRGLGVKYAALMRELVA